MNVFSPAVYIQNATLQYHQQLLFSKLNLTLESGKCTCILGASGVGKSSLLRLIAGLPTGNDLPSPNFSITTSDNQPLQSRIAYMAQQDLLLPWLTTLENVCLGYRIRKELNATHLAQARKLLTRVGLGAAIDFKPSQLSGGMKQRAALVRTLMENRPVILMDEPFNALDVVNKLRLQELSCELLANRTQLLITHDPLEALRIADHIYLMAGYPAGFSEVISPPDSKPRDINHPQLIALQAHIVNYLRTNSQEQEKIC